VRGFNSIAFVAVVLSVICIFAFVDSYAPAQTVFTLGEDLQNDLMKDLIAIIYSFSARIYGLRRGRQRANMAKEALCAEPA
jgi:predicted site-specific integrase-resolvase